MKKQTFGSSRLSENHNGQNGHLQSNTTTASGPGKSGAATRGSPKTLTRSPGGRSATFITASNAPHRHHGMRGRTGVATSP